RRLHAREPCDPVAALSVVLTLHPTPAIVMIAGVCAHPRAPSFRKFPLSSSRNDPGALLLMAFAVMVWGFSWIVMKYMTAWIGPFDLVFWRCVIAFLVLLALQLSLGQRFEVPPLGMSLAVAVLQTSGFQLLGQVGLTMGGGAAQVVSLAYTMPSGAAADAGAPGGLSAGGDGPGARDRTVEGRGQRAGADSGADSRPVLGCGRGGEQVAVSGPRARHAEFHPVANAVGRASVPAAHG